jgi:hypothetical protein
MFPFGDAYDILKELFRLITQGETDELILILALLGLVADIGWADGPAPDPADPANAAFALLKGLVKQIPPGPARDAIKEAFLRAARNTDEAPRFFAAFAQLAKHEEILTGLKNNPGALAAVLDAGPETMELLAKNEDVALELLKHGDDAASVLKSADAVRILGRNGPEAVGPLVKAATSDAPQAAIEAVGAALDLRRVGLTSPEAAELVDTITRLSTHGSGDRVVIGRFVEGAGYEREALDRGGIYYKTLDGVYDALGRNPELAWETNERFLRNQLEQGVPRIELVGESIAHIERHAVGTARWKEVQFLKETAEEYGYELAGNAWIKP